MTAATVTPAAAVEEAHAVLHIAAGAKWPEDGQARAEIAEAFFGLDVTLNCRQEPGRDRAAAEAADRLIKVMSYRCGPEWARITVGGDAGTEDEMTIPGVGK